MSETPLRILQLNTVFNGGGTDNQTMELAIGLSALGHTVATACPESRRCTKQMTEAGFAVRHVEPKSKPKLILQLRRLIRSEGFQVIHSHHGRDYWPAILAAKFSGKRPAVVVTRHLATLPSKASRLLLLRGVDALVAVSDHVRDLLLPGFSGPKERIHRIYGGIDLAKFHAVSPEAALAFRQEHGAGPDNVVFAVVGAFGLPRGKGQLEFVEAAALVLRTQPHARFWIIGQGSMRPLLEERIAKLGLGEIVRIIPFTDAIATAMNAIDVLVHPAVGTEALGLVLWEAMACGKPVIASRLGGIPEAFREPDHGMFVAPADVPQLASAMGVMASDPARRRLMGHAARAYATGHCSRERQAREMVGLYRSVLRSRV